MSVRDRKDLPHPAESGAAPLEENDAERAARKERESRALDEALQETFPTSDPISPFVPAVPLADTPAAEEARSCAHAGCGCRVEPPRQWCSDACRDQQQGYAPSGAACACAHPACQTGESRGAPMSAAPSA
jgi:hypothetical protein